MREGKGADRRSARTKGEAGERKAGGGEAHMKRYVSANQRYLAVVSPRNLAELIGKRRIGQITYQRKMPDRLKKRCA